MKWECELGHIPYEVETDEKVAVGSIMVLERDSYGCCYIKCSSTYGSMGIGLLSLIILKTTSFKRHNSSHYYFHVRLHPMGCDLARHSHFLDFCVRTWNSRVI